MSSVPKVNAVAEPCYPTSPFDLMVESSKVVVETLTDRNKVLQMQIAAAKSEICRNRKIINPLRAKYGHQMNLAKPIRKF